MATRQRPSGLPSLKKEETVSVEEFLDESSTEMFETILRTEEELVEKTEAPKPVILPEITPTEDVGPRFVEEAPAPSPQAVTPEVSQQLQPPPKRHPRNIPKFSRYK